MNDVVRVVLKDGLWRCLSVLLVGGFLLSVPTDRTNAADAVAGKTLALRWCASCHLVAEDQATASSTSLPSFFDIAKDNGWSEKTLSAFLADPHPKMPDMSLSTAETANLARYISSLSQ